MTNIKKFVAGIATIAMAITMGGFMPVQNAKAATAGEVYKTTDGTVWFITKDMQKRPFTSAGAFMSYGFLSFSQVKEADSSVNSLPTGSFIAPQDGRIFCATETKGSDVSGECSLITGSKKAAFTSASVFTGQGYSFSRAYYGDSSFLEKTSNIDNASAQHRPGTLINNNGTVQLVVSGGLWGVPSMDVFNAWGWSFADVVPANSADVLLSQTGIIPARQAGELVPTATTGGGSTNPGDCNLDGNAGSISVDKTSDYVSEEIAEGEEDQGVLSFEVEADDDSDVAITSIKVALYQATGADSQDLEDYVSEVKVWYGDEEVGSADADDFSENSDVYTKSISLDCSEVQAGETADFSISVSAVNSLDSSDIDTDAWTAELYSVRFEDGDGVTTTQNIGDQDVTAATANDVQEDFDFVDFATANDVELTTSLTDDEEDINETHIIQVDEDDKTSGEEVLAFSLEASGDSDIWVDEIPVDITVTGDVVSQVVAKVELYSGSTRIGTESTTGLAAATGQVVFDDLDMDIDAGDTEDFVVKVDLQKLTGNYAEAQTISASVDVADITAEDEEGDELAGGDLKGSAGSEDSYLYTVAPLAEFVSGTLTKDEGDADGTLVFTVTAIGGPIYIDAAAGIQMMNASGDDAYDVEDPTGTGVSSSPNANGNWKINEGSTATFTVNVSFAGGTAAPEFVRGQLEDIAWSATDDALPAGTLDAALLEDIKTNAVSVLTTP